MEDTFVWTDELVKEFANDLPIAINVGDKEIEDFIKSKQPDYIIIAVREKGTEVIIGTSYAGFFNPDHYEIYSVKRLTDNEVFTIGDRIWSKVNCPQNYQNIDKIELINNRIIYLNSCPLDNAVKSIKPAPLFTTIDGKDIYEGDSYVKVNDYSDYSIVTGFNAHGHHKDYKGLKFSTEEAAKEYVVRNRPCMSYNDVLNWLSKNGSGVGLLELAKQKIK